MCKVNWKTVSVSVSLLYSKYGQLSDAADAAQPQLNNNNLGPES